MIIFIIYLDIFHLKWYPLFEVVIVMFGLRLKELREKKGYSQAQLARILGVKQSTVGMWESGKNKPQNPSLEALANMFNVSTDYLLGRDTINNQKTSESAISIPVLGKIPAGIPIEAIEDIIDYEEIPSDWANGGKEYFSLQVKGNSMSPRYEDGDILILRKQDTCENGQDCAVMVNGNDATFKRVKDGSQKKTAPFGAA